MKEDLEIEKIKREIIKIKSDTKISNFNLSINITKFLAAIIGSVIIFFF